MYRTLKVPFRASKHTIQILFDIRRLCGVVWNDCVQIGSLLLSFRWISGSHKPTCKKN